MNKRFFITVLLFLIIGIKAFSNAGLEDVAGRGFWSKTARVYINDTLPELNTGSVNRGERIKGVVYFEGFDFSHYDAESKGIEPMLEETYVLLKEFYAAENQSDKKPVPFVFLGHSQGGLRSVAMSTYLKNKDPVLYKQLKGVVTFSGIDKGLKLLENKGANFRSGLYTDVNILTDGIYGTVKVLDFTPTDFISDFIFNSIFEKAFADGVYALGNLFLCNWLGLTKGFAYPIMNNTGWNSYAQIRDMCPQSDFVKKYVLEEKPYYYKVASGTTLEVVWKKGWLGIRYPTLERRTVYSTVQTTDVNMKVDKNLPLNFLIGGYNDSLSMADETTRNNIDKGMRIAGDVFNAAYIAHIAKSCLIIGLFTNSPAYASDCNKAADWCYNYKREINELIGESANDGLVAVSSQQLPVYSKVGSSAETKILNKTNRIIYNNRNHANITDIGSASRNKINDYADEILGIKNRTNKKR
ncbi:hypothetical protein SAMN04487977_102117 [Treponema bryantii]|uniref:Uncharacterized protein n=1 Tax=Treponema bryantii TaxID=163 RepID=A0A1H9CBK3_9SPIR|nr:hypothetical protein [Treponema bryantii]BDC92486.1 hypothetical protein TRBR_05830 [Treponema bryantii]SEP98566.1 hypothetical protein SAMN04487977_102117 [Treponema bryantii]